MSGALAAIAPFFAIVLIGWLSARRGMISEAGLGGLNAFIFNISLPPLLFQTMAAAPERGFGAEGAGWTLLAAYGLATLTLYIGAMLIGTVLFGLRGPSRTLFGHLSANGNVGFLGLPLGVAALGPEAALPTAMILTFDIVVVMSATTLLLERAKTAAPVGPLTASPAASAAAPLRGVGSALQAAFLNPIILGALGGVAWGAVGRGALGLEMVEPLDRLLNVLGQAAAPAALFAVGATLAHKKSDRRYGEITAITILKLIVHPALTVLTLSLLAPNTPQLWIAAAVLAAANPASNNAVIFANIYRVYEARASATVLASTALSLITFAALAAWIAVPLSPS
ncbi:MAG: AEC family transporter [Rhodobacteraceae bacterium]|nr:AEC family transporter [Paracoccaceae bacterium]